MKFLAPAGLWLLALSIPIFLLYMLKLRRKKVQVSSTFLWMRLLRDKQANAPWQKLKRNLFLLLQLLILAALVVALSRPAVETPAVASGSVVVLMDASASMSTTDIKPSRFEVARHRVQALIDNLAAGSSMTIILVGRAPEVLVASEQDKDVLGAALARAAPTQGGVDWLGAFTLAAGAARGSRDNTTVIVSDGGLPENGLPALPGDTLYVPVGGTDDNVAITALALRSARTTPELFAEVTNFGALDHPVLLSFYFGDRLLSARRIDLPAHARRSMTLDETPAGPGVYMARITSLQGGSPDVLSLDNTAFAVYQAASTRRVLLISKGNFFLEQLLASLPGIQPFRLLPDKSGNLQLPADAFDLYVLDGVYPDLPATGNLLIVNPPANPLFEVGAPFKEMDNVRLKQADLTRYVDWSGVHILQAKTVRTPAWAEPLVEVDKGPLVFAGSTNGRRVAVLTFDLRESDLPLQVAYPILLSNLMDYLVPRNAFDSTQSLHPGESLAIVPPLGVDRITVATPARRLIPVDLSTSAPLFTSTGELGYYAVNFLAGDRQTVDYFAVNLFDSAESDIGPRPAIQVGRTSVSASASHRIGQRELWPWLAGLALLVLMLEWQLYHRRKIPLHLIPGSRTQVS